MTFPFRLAVAWILLLGWPALASAVGLAGIPDRLHYQEYPGLEGRPVRRVLILGNNRTKEEVFRREMRLEEGVPFRAEDMWRDWERIVDLGLFAEVEVEPVPSGDGVLVVVSVYERPWWFATPVANYDFDEKKISVGYRARVRNIGGLNQTLRSNARIGRNDQVSVSWETPWLGRSRLALTGGLDVELPRAGEDELRTTRLYLSSTRYLGNYKLVRKGATIFTRVEKLDRDGTHPQGEVRQLTPVVGIGWFRDTRNVRIDPTRGTLASASGEIVSGWADDDLGYGRSVLDARGFLAVRGGVVLAARTTATLTTGTTPDYRLLGVGGDNSIRGQPESVEVGENSARASAEIRFPILGQRRFALPIPFVPRRISNVDFRVDGELFVDAGTAWDDSDDFPVARVRGGAGFGLRVFLPILELARFEIAFDQAGKATFYLSEDNLI